MSDGKHVVLLMDHQSAEVYSDLLSGAAPASELTPEDPKGYVDTFWLHRTRAP